MYKKTNTWFDNVSGILEYHLRTYNPSKILEIGSYEGISSCFMVDVISPLHELELHCIDVWKNGEEHNTADFSQVESYFNDNISLCLSKSLHKVECYKHVGYSDEKLGGLLSSGKRNYFDLIYVDGGHFSDIVICDAVMSFRLLKIGGIMGFDDYNWDHSDKLMNPRTAIDYFVDLYRPKLKILEMPTNQQLWIQKISD